MIIIIIIKILFQLKYQKAKSTLRYLTLDFSNQKPS